MSEKTDAVPSPGSSSPKKRLTGLDGVRALAAILVVMLHAAHAYIPFQMPGLAWPAHDAHPSEFVDGIFWWIEGFIMPLFLFLSGYFAFGLLQKLGPAGFMKHRIQRIVYPLLFGCACILPLDFYAWGIGFAMDGRASWRKLRSMKYDPPISDQLFGLSHLWYLQYVFLYCALLLVVRECIRRFAPQDATRTISIERGRPEYSFRQPMSLSAWLTILWVCGSAVLFFAPEVVIGFQHSFFPVPTKFVYSGLFFFGGAIVAVHGMTHLRSGAVPCLLASAVCAAFMVVSTRNWFVHGHSPVEQTAYSGITCAFAWFSVLGICGTAMRRQSPLPQSVKFVAEASFWIYLLHHPVVGLSQALLGLTSLPAELKFLIATSATVVICLVTYVWFVRTTWIGALLNGKPRQSVRPAEIPSDQQSARAA